MVYARAANRLAKNLGVLKRSDVQGIVDAANTQTAVLRNQEGSVGISVRMYRIYHGDSQ